MAPGIPLKDHQPVTVDLALRASESSPTRVRAEFTVPLTDREVRAAMRAVGKRPPRDLPAQVQATIASFRLEMN